MNKKLSLELDQLAVESFETSQATRPAGTVRGFGFTDTTCNQIICDCPTGGTCDTDCGQVSCDGTCVDATCGGNSCINLCPTGNMHTCIQPNCFHTYECVSSPNYTECCLQ